MDLLGMHCMFFYIASKRPDLNTEINKIIFDQPPKILHCDHDMSHHVVLAETVCPLPYK